MLGSYRSGHPYQSTRYRSGDRIIIHKGCATVISKLDFEQFATEEVKEIFNRMIPLTFGSLNDPINYVYIKWDNGGYDWYWEWHCQLLPSSKLANGARSNV